MADNTIQGSTETDAGAEQSAPAPTVRVNLALQGGGAHGAFTWGVLDRLLEETDIEIAAISGTSAGAMNGAAFKSGWVSGGQQGARERLDWLWQTLLSISEPVFIQWLRQISPLTSAISQQMEIQAAHYVSATLSHVASPYLLGPFYRNPLTDIARALDTDSVHVDAEPYLYIGTTNVRTGKIRVFSCDELTPEVLLASACLPTLFQAVHLHDPRTGITDPYWDGGFTGNPALFPLFEPGLPNDIIIVNINPLERAGLPQSPAEIQNRVNEISFNSSLLRELRAINFVKRLLADKLVAPGSMKDVNVHMIADDETMTEFSAATKLMVNSSLVNRLKTAGRNAAARFLEENRHLLGVRSSVDLQRMFD